MPAYVYILKCSDNTLYTGWTTCLAKRVEMHNKGKASKYTRARRPVEIVHSETYEKKEDAMRRENEIKRLPRSAKLSICTLITVEP